MFLKKRINIIICILSLLVLFSILHFSFLKFDSNSIKDGKKPVFSFKVYDVDDGGSKGYLGFGYRIECIHSLCDENKDGKTDGFLIGTETKGIPLIDKIDKLFVSNSTKFVPYNFK